MDTSCNNTLSYKPKGENSLLLAAQFGDKATDYISVEIAFKWSLGPLNVIEEFLNEVEAVQNLCMALWVRCLWCWHFVYYQFEM